MKYCKFFPLIGKPIIIGNHQIYLDEIPLSVTINKNLLSKIQEVSGTLLDYNLINLTDKHNYLMFHIRSTNFFVDESLIIVQYLIRKLEEFYKEEVIVEIERLEKTILEYQIKFLDFRFNRVNLDPFDEIKFISKENFPNLQLALILIKKHYYDGIDKIKIDNLKCDLQNLKRTWMVKIFLLSVALTDDYFRLRSKFIKMNVSVENNKAVRFFKMITLLPLELQSLICNLLVDDRSSIIRSDLIALHINFLW